VHGHNSDGSARLFRANIIQPGTNNLVNNFDPAQVTYDGKNQQKLENYGGNARLKWEYDQVNLYSITGYETMRTYSRGDIDGGYGASYAPPYGPGFIPFSDETADGLSGHKQFTQEFRIESKNAGPFNWQTGLYYFHEEYNIDSYTYDSLFTNGAQVSPGGDLKTHQKNDAWAVFGSVNYDLTDALKLRAGLRYTKDKKQLVTQPDSTINTAAGLTAAPSDSRFSGDLSATYVLSPDVNLYARVANGFRGSSIQPASAFNALSVAKPETNTSFEVGLKADLLNKRARLSFDVFNYEIKNQQLTAVGGSTNANILLNAKKTQGQGFELNLDAYVTDNLLVTVGSSYNKTKIKDPGLIVAGCGGGCTVTNKAAPGVGNYYIDGNPLPQAPKWIGNFTARYGIPTASGGEYFIYTDWAYRSKVNFFLYESTEFTGKALTEGGLRAGYNWDYGKYEVAAYGRNITNQIRIVGGIDFNNLTGFINDPRTWGVQFKAKF
jgi:iron complex outermembrane receptor protein